MHNLNVYNVDAFQSWFSKTQLYLQMQNDFDILTWDTDLSSFMLPEMTPRQYRGTRIFSMVPFYYINQLGMDSKIYDVGCGWNVYKKYLPNITGIAGEHKNSTYYYGDKHGLVDDQYVENNMHQFDNIMSMNALHFIPLSSFAHRIRQIKKITKPGGKIFIMMNVCQMIALESSELKNHAAEYIRREMDQFANEVGCFELDDTKVGQNLSEGTLRFVMQNNE